MPKELTWESVIDKIFFQCKARTSLPCADSHIQIQKLHFFPVISPPSWTYIKSWSCSLFMRRSELQPTKLLPNKMIEVILLSKLPAMGSLVAHFMVWQLATLSSGGDSKGVVWTEGFWGPVGSFFFLPAAVCYYKHAVILSLSSCTSTSINAWQLFFSPNVCNLFFILIFNSVLILTLCVSSTVL